METRQFLGKINQKLFILTIIMQLFFSSCNKEYEYNIAYVYKTRFYHWGQGFYKLEIYYKFEYRDSVLQGCVKTPGLYEVYGVKHFREGDSVFIKYPAGKPEKGELANYKVKRKKTMPNQYN